MLLAVGLLCAGPPLRAEETARHSLEGFCAEHFTLLSPEAVDLAVNPHDWWAFTRPYGSERYPELVPRVRMSPEQHAVYLSYFEPRLRAIERLGDRARTRTVALLAISAETRLCNESMAAWRRLVRESAAPDRVAAAYDLAMAWHRSALMKLVVLAAAAQEGTDIPLADRASLAASALAVSRTWLELNGYTTSVATVPRIDDLRRTQQVLLVEPPASEARGALRDVALDLQRRATADEAWQLAVSPTEYFFGTTQVSSLVLVRNETRSRVAIPFLALLELRLGEAQVQQLQSMFRQNRQADRGLPSAFQGNFIVARRDARAGIEQSRSMQAFASLAVPRPDRVLTTRQERNGLLVQLTRFTQAQYAQASSLLELIAIQRFFIEETRRDLALRPIDAWGLREVASREGVEFHFFGSSRILLISDTEVTFHAAGRIVSLPRTVGPLGDAAAALYAVPRGSGPRMLTLAQNELMWRLLTELQRRLEVMEGSIHGHMYEVADLISGIEAYATARTEESYRTLLTAIDGVAILNPERHTLRGILARPDLGLDAGNARPPLVAGPAEGIAHRHARDVVVGLAAAPGSVERNRALEQAGMDAVIEHAFLRGWMVRVVANDNAGYDVLVEDAATGRRYFIEVKARHSEADTLTLSRRESEFAVAHAEEWLLAVVLVGSDGIARLHLRNNLGLAALSDVEEARVLGVPRLLARPPVQLPAIARPREGVQLALPQIFEAIRDL